MVDANQAILIADLGNNRVVQWKIGDVNGKVVAGGHGWANGLNQLYCPTDVLIDKRTDSLIIADQRNRRVVRWFRRSDTIQGEILLENIGCYGLAMDSHQCLYVSDIEKHEVKRYIEDDKNGSLAAGGRGQGSDLNQLNYPTYIFVDKQQNLYVSDNGNHRVMKWSQGATEGITVAGGRGQGSDLKQLSYPNGLFVDERGNVYVVDSENNRVMCWSQGEEQGIIIAGGNGSGQGADQLHFPIGLFFDDHANLYVADHRNHRIQKFSIE